MSQKWLNLDIRRISSIGCLEQLRYRFWRRSSLLIWPQGFIVAKYKALGNTLIWFELVRSVTSCTFSHKSKGLICNGRIEHFLPLSFYNALPANKKKGLCISTSLSFTSVWHVSKLSMLNIKPFAFEVFHIIYRKSPLCRNIEQSLLIAQFFLFSWMVQSCSWHMKIQVTDVKQNSEGLYVSAKSYGTAFISTAVFFFTVLLSFLLLLLQKHFPASCPLWMPAPLGSHGHISRGWQRHAAEQLQLPYSSSQFKAEHWLH